MARSHLAGRHRPRPSEIGLAVAILAACGARSEQPSSTGSGAPPPTASDAHAEAPRTVKRAPHGAAIELLAVTEAGDAAISADTKLGLRLWPSLDGKREPVVVRSVPPHQLALARHAAGFVVAVLDQAGGGEILDLDRDGAVRTRARLPAEPAFVQLVALSAGVLARRSDHAVVLLDIAGRVRGTVTAQPSEQIVTLATRRGAALAGIGDRAGSGVSRLRWLEVAPRLAWGATVTLPEPLDAAIALAPGGRRIAGATARRDWVVMIALAPAPRTIKQRAMTAAMPGLAIGFVDDDTAIVPDGSILRAGGDASEGLAGHVDSEAPIATADGGTVLGNEAGLERNAVTAAGLGDTYYLGYRDHAIGDLDATATSIVHEFDGRVYWLDRDLTSARAFDASFADNGEVVVLDDQRVLQRVHLFPRDMPGRDPEPGSRLVVMDAVTGRVQPLGTWSGSDPVYEPGSHVLALVGTATTAYRLRLDLDKLEATPLPPLRIRALSTVLLFDPAAANGVCATAITIEIDRGNRGSTQVEVFLEQPPGAKLIKPSRSQRLAKGSPITADRAGILYVHEGNAIALYDRGVRKRAFPVEPSLRGGININDVRVDPAGSLLTLIDAASVVAIDVATGAVRWRAPAWSPRRTVFASDGKTVAVLVEGGLLVLDAATGKQLATACGWGFGLTRARPRTSMLGTPVACDAD